MFTRTVAEKMQIEELLLLEQQVCSAVQDAKTFKEECKEVRRRTKLLSQMLSTLFYCINVAEAEVPLYLRPIKCILSEVNDNLKLALTIVSKCKRQSLIGRLFTSRDAGQFHELFHHLDASISDMEWLITLYDPRNEAIGPMTNKKSAKLLVWSCIAAVQMGRKLEDRLQAAKCLALIAQEKDEFKEIIFEEGGVPPLQKLFRGNSSLEAQITVANALFLLANEESRKKAIMNDMISTIENRLSRKWPLKSQIQAADLVANIAEHNPGVKEFDLIRENIIWRLVTLLSSEQSTDDHRMNTQKLKLKASCSKALLILAQGSVSNCRTLTETKGMLCLAKMVEKEKGEIKKNCLMILKEITSLAELNEEFRHSAFKTTSKAAKAAVDQLQRVIEESDDTKLRIAAIKSIGSLARSFSAKHSQIISPLVSQLGNTSQEVALEAAISLRKFVSPENGLSLEHSKSIVEFNCIPLLMNLLEGNKELQLHGIALLCYLAKHDENCHALIKAEALTALGTTGRKVAAEHPELKEVFSETIKVLQSKHVDDRHEESKCSPKGSIKQIIIERFKGAFDSLKCGSSTLFKGLTGGITERIVKFEVKLLSIEMRGKKRLQSAVSCLRKRWILPLLKVKCEHLASGYAIDQLIGDPLRLQVEEKLRLMKEFLKKLGKKVRLYRT